MWSLSDPDMKSGPLPALPFRLSAELEWKLGSDAASLRYTETEDAFHIDHVLVPAQHRSQGIGSFLVRRVLLLADRLAKEVHLDARIIGGGASEERLQRLLHFYGRFGFEPVSRGVTLVHLVRQRRSSADFPE